MTQYPPRLSADPAVAGPTERRAVGHARPGSRLLLVAAMLAGVSFIVGAMLAWQNYRSERNRQVEATGLFARATATEVDQSLRDWIRLIESLAVAPAVRAADYPAMQSYFADVLSTQPDLAGLALIGRDGVLPAEGLADPSTGPVYLGDRDYFREVLATGRPAVGTTNLSRVNLIPGFSIATAVRDRDGGLRGVLSARVLLSAFERSLANLHGGANGDILIIDRAGQLIADADPTTETFEAVPNTALLERMERQGIGTITGVTGLRNLPNRMIGFAPVPTGGWLVAVSRPADQVLAPARRTFWWTMSGLTVVLLGGMLGAVWAARRLNTLDAAQRAALAEATAAVAQRRAAEVSLAESATELRLITDAVPVLISYVTADQRYRFNNRAYEVWFGLPPDTVTGRTLEEVFGAAAYEVLHPSVDAALSGEMVSFERFVPYRHGGSRWIEATYIPDVAADGTVHGYYALTVDISERKQAEEAQRLLAEIGGLFTDVLDVESRLTALVEAVVPSLAEWAGVDMLEPDGSLRRSSFAHADPEKRELMRRLREQYPPTADGPHPVAQAIRSRTSQLVAEPPPSLRADVAQDEEHLRLLEAIGLASYMVVPLVARGRVLGAVTLARGTPGRPYGPVDLALAEELARRAALAVDNALLYEVERQAHYLAERTTIRLARLQGLTAALAETLTTDQVGDVIVKQGLSAIGADGGGVALINDDGTLVLLRGIGYFRDLLNEGPVPLDRPAPHTDTARTGEPLWLEALEERTARYPHLAGRMAQHGPGAVAALPLTVERQTIGVLAVTFMSARSFPEEDRAFMLALARQCAQALQRSRLYEAERLARAEAEAASRARDEFLSILSHELRTPLTSILGWTKMLRTRRRDEATTERALETIEKSARAQAQLVEDILDVSRGVTGRLRVELTPLDLSPVLLSAADPVRPAAEAKQIDLRVKIAPNLPAVAGDAGRLQQVIWNLLVNAVKFTPGGGVIDLRVSRDGGDACITVSDSGVGIEPRFLPYVFDRFRQADSSSTRRYGGLGLGLAIVRHLVELHGGAVGVDSEGEGKGATFTVRLPLLPESGDARDHAPLPGLTGSRLDGVRVLVVQEQESARELITDILEGSGAAVTAVSSVAAALAALEQKRPDVVVSNIAMPSEDGDSLIARVRAAEAGSGRRLPAVALTAFAGDRDRQQALDAGFDQYLHTPVAPDELITAVGQLVNQSLLRLNS